MTEVKKVIVSSTVLDLPLHRQKVRDACLRLRLLPLMMEQLPASSADAVRVSRALVNDADMYVGVFAHRYGFVPDGQETSITEMEYELAKQRGIERLIFVMADDHPIVIGDVEFGGGREKIAALKDRLLAENTVGFFHSPEDLSASVIFSLSHYLGPMAESFRLDGAKQRAVQSSGLSEPGSRDHVLWGFNDACEHGKPRSVCTRGSWAARTDGETTQVCRCANCE